MDPVAHCPEDCDGPECDCPPRAGGACPWHAWQHAAGHLAAELDAARARAAELEAAGRELVDTIDRADYGEASRAITGASDDFRAVLNTIPKG
jgi:hypothetical protein